MSAFITFFASPYSEHDGRAREVLSHMHYNSIAIQFDNVHFITKSIGISNWKCGTVKMTVCWHYSAQMKCEINLWFVQWVSIIPQKPFSLSFSLAHTQAHQRNQRDENSLPIFSVHIETSFHWNSLFFVGKLRSMCGFRLNLLWQWIETVRKCQHWSFPFTSFESYKV